MQTVIHELESSLAETTDPNEKIDLLNKLAFEYQYVDLEKATAVAQKAQSIVMQMETAGDSYLKGKADTLQTLSFIHLRQQNDGLKMPLLLQVLTIYRELNDTEGEARTLTIMGLTYMRMGQLEESLGYFNQSLDISKTGEHHVEIARAYNGLGLINQVTQKNEVALYYYQESAEISRKLNDMRQVAIALGNCAASAQNMGKYDQAIDFGQESADLSRQVGNKISEGYAKLGIARARIRKGELDTALKLLQENAEQLQDSPDHYLFISNLIVTGRVYDELEYVDEAVAMFERALFISEENGLKELCYTCHQNLSKVFKKQGEFALALDHYEQFHKQNELVFDERMNSRLQSLAVIHQTEAAQKEAQILQAANEELTQEILERKRVEDQLRYYQNQLEELVFARTSALEEANATLLDEIQERQQIQAEREEMIAELEVKNAELERFTYTVSHDLKSPLVTIEGFLGYLERDALQGDKVSMMEDVRHIRDATKQMHVLLEDLLELSRVGRIMNPPEWTSFTQLAEEAVSRVRGQILNAGVTVEVSPDLPLVLVDRPRLVEAVQNLMDNSTKFMGKQPEPRVEIGVRLQGDVPIFFVQDNGIGIEHAYHNKVFGLFERLDHSIEGTGIGLALVKRIIEVHNGRLWVESEGLGQGSAFCFTLNQELKSDD